MRKIFISLCLLLVAACGSDNPTGPVAPPSLTGSWTMTFTMAGEITLSYPGEPVFRYPVSCTGPVPVAITDTDGTLTGAFQVGTIICNVDGDVQQVDWSGPLSGKRTNKSVTFSDGLCTYTGNNLTSGTAVCVDTATYYLFTMDGTWKLLP